MLSNKEMLINIVHDLKNQGNQALYLKKRIKLYLDNGFNINSKYLKGRTLGHYCVMYNVKGMVGYLSKLGLNLDICDDLYDTPLHKAVRDNKLILVKELIASNVDINLGAEFDETALHIAVSENNAKMVELLLSSGADKSLVDEKNKTPLDYALDENNDKIVNLLMTKK